MDAIAWLLAAEASVIADEFSYLREMWRYLFSLRISGMNLPSIRQSFLHSLRKLLEAVELLQADYLA